MPIGTTIQLHARRGRGRWGGAGGVGGWGGRVGRVGGAGGRGGLSGWEQVGGRRPARGLTAAASRGTRPPSPLLCLPPTATHPPTLPTHPHTRSHCFHASPHERERHRHAPPLPPPPNALIHHASPHESEGHRHAHRRRNVQGEEAVAQQAEGLKGKVCVWWGGVRGGGGGCGWVGGCVGVVGGCARASGRRAARRPTLARTPNTRLPMKQTTTPPFPPTWKKLMVPPSRMTFTVSTIAPRDTRANTSCGWGGWGGWGGWVRGWVGWVGRRRGAWDREARPALHARSPPPRPPPLLPPPRAPPPPPFSPPLTEKVFEAVCAPMERVMARPRVKNMGPHRSQLRSAADCWERSLKGNTTMTCPVKVRGGGGEGGCPPTHPRAPKTQQAPPRSTCAPPSAPPAPRAHASPPPPPRTRFFQMRRRSRLIVSQMGSSSVFGGTSEASPPPPPPPPPKPPLVLTGTSPDGAAVNSCTVQGRRGRRQAACARAPPRRWLTRLLHILLLLPRSRLPKARAVGAEHGPRASVQVARRRRCTRGGRGGDQAARRVEWAAHGLQGGGKCPADGQARAGKAGKRAARRHVARSRWRRHAGPRAPPPTNTHWHKPP